MLTDFYGKVIADPTAGALRATTDSVKALCAEHGIKDSIVAAEMTGT